jgi:sulfur carrier protein
MKVFINGEQREVPDGLTLEAMVEHLSLPERRMAIELNETVVRKKDWDNLRINNDDRIEIVHFVGGG